MFSLKGKTKEKLTKPKTKIKLTKPKKKGELILIMLNFILILKRKIL